jgi:hypothetical protein
MKKRVAAEIGAFIFFLAIAIIATWPLAKRLGTGASDSGDPLLNAWILDWDCYAAVHQLGDIYQAHIFHPAKYPLAFSENMFGIALIIAPFHAAGLPPLVVYNIAMLLGFALSGYGAYVLGRVMTGSVAAALLAGFLYELTPFRFDHLAHLQIVWSGWLPLILASTLLYRRKPTWRNAIFVGVCLLMNGLTNVHWLLFGGVAWGITVLLPGVIDGWRARLRLFAAAGVAMLLMVPVLLPYRTVSKLYNMERTPAEVRFNSATLDDWLTGGARTAAYMNIRSEEHVHGERRLFPGLMVLLLTGAAFLLRSPSPPRAEAGREEPARWLLHTLDALIVAALIATYFGAAAHWYELKLFNTRIFSIDKVDIPLVILIVLVIIRLSLAFPRAWGEGNLREVFAESDLAICVVWIIIGVLGSLGLNAFFHTFLYRFPLFHSIRGPGRWAIIAYTGLAGTSAVGAAALLRKQPRLVLAGLWIAAIFDVRPMIRWEPIITEPAPVYRWIVDQHVDGPFLELPVNDNPVAYVFTQAYHRQPIMNGYSGFAPPFIWKLSEDFNQPQISDSVLPTIRNYKMKYLIVHEDLLGDHAPAVHDWLRRNLDSGALAFVRRFDNHKPGGDWVFALTWHGDWPVLADRKTDWTVTALLKGWSTYSFDTFGVLESPAYFDSIGYPAVIRGWALSPRGIRGVHLLFDSGRKRIPANLVPREDISHHYRWYPNVPRPGFEAVFPKRPKGVPRETDLQVEIIDGNGKRTRLPSILMQWR